MGQVQLTKPDKDVQKPPNVPNVFDQGGWHLSINTVVPPPPPPPPITAESCIGFFLVIYDSIYCCFPILYRCLVFFRQSGERRPSVLGGQGWSTVVKKQSQLAVPRVVLPDASHHCSNRKGWDQIIRESNLLTTLVLREIVD